MNSQMTSGDAGDVAKMRGAGFRIMGLLQSDAVTREVIERGATSTLPRVRCPLCEPYMVAMLSLCVGRVTVERGYS